MPRIELPRPRAFFCGRLPERRLERFLAGLYIFSSAAFLLGSIFFLPEFAGEPPEFSPEYEAGCWLYQLGSVGFMTVSAFDFEEARRNKSPFSPYVAKMLGASFDRVLAGLYLAGMSGFVIGCVFFFPVNENDLGEASNDAGSSAAAVLSAITSRNNTSASSRPRTRCTKPPSPATSYVVRSTA